MNLGEAKKDIRRRLDDVAAPFLWSDAEIVSYINEAQKEAAERALLIYDETSSLTEIAVQAGVATYDLDPRVLRVDRVFSVDRGRALNRTTVPVLDQESPRWEVRQGRPHSFIEEARYLRLFPIPAAAGEIRLSLWRVPLEPFGCDAQNDEEFEIDARHHVRMLDWALSLAYLKRDVDTYDEQKSAVYAAKFTESFGVRPDANMQRKQRIKRVPICRPSW